MRTAVLTLAFTSTVLLAQAPPVEPRFEVVSIKRNMSNALGSNGSSERPDGGFTLLNIPLMTLIGRAQFPPIAPIDMAGLPEWAQRDRYDVSATSPLGRPATPEERAAMLRAMLAERAKLITHVEKREMSVYDLVLARSDGRLGPGIKPSEMDCVAKAAADRAAAEAALAAGTPPRPAIPDMNAPPPVCGPIRVTNGMEGDTTMENLARLLRGVGGAGRPVVDKTGLTGSYRIKLEFDRSAGQTGPSISPSAAALPTVFTALQEQAGLKLESSKAEREVLVIDRLERPTEN
jgi:uncharacterized protein (TIGR03435 family)